MVILPAGYTPDTGGASTESVGNDVTSLILTNSCSSKFVYTGAGGLLCLALILRSYNSATAGLRVPLTYDLSVLNTTPQTASSACLQLQL